MPEYLQPKTLEEALSALSQSSYTPLAGGTDFYPPRSAQIIKDPILDLSKIGSLQVIEERADHWRIGATATWSDIINADLPELFDCLKLAAREVGGQQIQNIGTIAGNICNASPAADSIPPLLALNAKVELESIRRTRTVNLYEFITGNRTTSRDADELLTGITIPRPMETCVSTFLKLGARKYLVISVVMVAVVLELDVHRIIKSARIAVGSCSPVAQRLPQLEDDLIGKKVGSNFSETPSHEHLLSLTPIDDIRSKASYRKDAALTLVIRALEELETKFS